MSVVVTEANASERLGATVALLEQCCDAKVLELIWVDSGYSGENLVVSQKRSEDKGIFLNAYGLLCNSKKLRYQFY